MQKLLISVSIIFAGLLFGYAIQRAVKSYRPAAVSKIPGVRRTLQKIALLALNPIAALGAIWVFQLDNLRIAFLPVLGVLTLVAGGSAGLVIGRVLKLPPRKAGAFFATGGMFNIGSIGALIVFIFLGERGFALVPLFRLFEEFTYYAFGFPIAKSFSPLVRQAGERRLRAILLDPFVLVQVGSISLGFALNLLSVPRPAFYSHVNGVVIPIASFLLLVSIGLAMRFGSIRGYFRESIYIAGIKFLFVPAIVGAAAVALGMGTFDGGLPLAVIIILSSMPVGFIALVPPSIYDLDVDLANAAWMVTTALLVIVIPLQMLIIQAIMP